MDTLLVPLDSLVGDIPKRVDKQLLRSIEQHGMLVPVLVRPLNDGRYLVVDGRRRVAVARELGFETVSAVIAPESADSNVAAVVANMVRSESIATEARAIANMIAKGMTIDEIANTLGLPKGRVKRLARYAGLPEEVLVAYEEGRVSRSVLEAVSRHPQWAVAWLTEALQNKEQVTMGDFNEEQQRRRRAAAGRVQSLFGDLVQSPVEDVESRSPQRDDESNVRKLRGIAYEIARLVGDKCGCDTATVEELAREIVFILAAHLDG